MYELSEIAGRGNPALAGAEWSESGTLESATIWLGASLRRGSLGPPDYRQFIRFRSAVTWPT